MKEQNNQVNRMFEFTRCVVLVSRRAAGVWTNLPSLTYSLLSKLQPPISVLWIDFGLRYEMFNHFRINPLNFSERSCLLGLISRYTSGDPINCEDLISYDQIVINKTSSNGESIPPISEIQGKGANSYADYITKLTSEHRKIYMVPLQVPSLPLDGTAIDIDLNQLEKTLMAIVRELRPAFTFLTCEGQPESRIFSNKIEEDKVLRWCLDTAEMILCLVRFDSEQRFEDSVAIPTILSKNPNWSARLNLVLTRILNPPVIRKELQRYVLGYLPFAKFIAESVDNGRIPIIDSWSKQTYGEISEEEIRYLALIETLSKGFCSLKNKTEERNDAANCHKL